MQVLLFLACDANGRTPARDLGSCSEIDTYRIPTENHDPIYYPEPKEHLTQQQAQSVIQGCILPAHNVMIHIRINKATTYRYALCGPLEFPLQVC